MCRTPHPCKKHIFACSVHLMVGEGHLVGSKEDNLGPTSFYFFHKGWGVIDKLRKEKVLLVRFGCNLAQLLRDSPWGSDPGYTQIQQVNKSTLRVNTMSSTAKTKPSSKEKKWSDLGETWLSCSGFHPEALTQVTPKSDKSISQHFKK